MTTNISAIKTQENPRTLTILAPKTNLPIDIVFEYISPAMAKQWLGDNVDNNRTPNKRYITGYAKTMKDGLWSCTNGESIKFNQDGELVDGQHRLMAVIEADVKVWMLVFYGVNNKDIHTLDDGNKRKLRDVLTIRGEKIKGRLTSIEGAIRALYILRDCFSKDTRFNNMRTQHITNAELIEFLTRMTDFKEICQKLHETYSSGSVEQIIPMGTLLPMYYLFHDVYPDEVDTIFKSFADKIPSDGLATKSPTWHVMRRISINRENQTTMRAEDYINYFIWCMLALKAGGPVKSMPPMNWQFRTEFDGRLTAKQKLQRT